MAAMRMPSKRAVIIALGLLAIAAVVLFVTSPRVLALYYLYWGRDSFRQLFYEGLGLSEATSSLLSTILAFFYGVAWILYTAYLFSLSRSLDFKKMALGFVGFIIVYASAPLAHVIYSQVGPVVCFNQATGKPQAWYVIRSGSIYIFDSDGFDATDGTKKLPVTREVCRAYEQQRRREVPQKLGYEKAFELPGSSVWFWSSGTVLEVYDRPGLRPGTNDLLQTTTPELSAQLTAAVERIRKQQREAERKEQNRLAAEAKRLAEEQAQEQQRVLQEQAARAKTLRDAADKERADNISYLLARVAESKTGYECALDDAGVHFDGDVLAFSELQASADWFRWDASNASMMSPTKTETALGVLLRGSPSKVCLVFVVQPAPLTLTSETLFAIDKVIAAVASLGVNVVQKRPQGLHEANMDASRQAGSMNYGLQLPGIVVVQPIPASGPVFYGYGVRAGPQFYYGRVGRP